VWQGFLGKCSFLDVEQGVYFKRFLRRCKAICQLVTFVDICCECCFDTGSSCLVNIGKSSGTYTDGGSRFACVAPCSSGRVRISPEVIEQVVVFRINPAPESVRVCYPNVVPWTSNGHLTPARKMENSHVSMPQQGRCLIVEHKAPPAGSFFSCSLKVQLGLTCN